LASQSKLYARKMFRLQQAAVAPQATPQSGTAGGGTDVHALTGIANFSA